MAEHVFSLIHGDGCDHIAPSLRDYFCPGHWAICANDAAHYSARGQRHR